MRIRAGFEITFETVAPTPMLLLVNVRPERAADLEHPDTLIVSSYARYSRFTDVFGNICTRVLLPPGVNILSTEFVIHDSGQPDPVTPGAILAPVESLPDDVVVYLLSSRYCEIDKLSDLAWSLFGALPRDWSLVQAIVDYAHQRITFGYQHARVTKTAWDAHEEQQGVCRDFAHLAITLCRCMNIPARYCTGYLGDIGIPPVDAPMDFSAWFEVWIDGAWHTFDARHNKPRIGRIPMARGRDATDAAISTNFGPALLTGFTVITEEIPDAA
jgi:transglutaminase-like putative cysteine protease